MVHTASSPKVISSTFGSLLLGVALFAYGRTALAPVDTWIGKVIRSEYGGENPFPAYSEAAGIMQQYVFYYALNHKRELKSG